MVGIEEMLTNMGMEHILLWLLSFAIINGLLGQAKMPESKASRAIISIVSAFFVLFAVPGTLIDVLKEMTQGLVLIIVGLLVLFVFFEVAGVRVGSKVYVVDPKTGKKELAKEKVKVHEAYGGMFAAFLAIMAILLFVGAGGLQLLGWDIPDFSELTTMSFLFFVVIIGAIAYMIKKG